MLRQSSAHSAGVLEKSISRDFNPRIWSNGGRGELNMLLISPPRTFGKSMDDDARGGEGMGGMGTYIDPCS